VKNSHPIGRLITSPLLAVIVCAGGASAIWFGMLRQSGGTPEPNPRGRHRTNSPSVNNRRPGSADHHAANEASPTPKPQNARDRIGSLTDDQPRKSTVQGKLEIEEFVAENEPLAPSPNAVAAGRSRGTGRESAAPSTSDTIGPRDPRARALKAYEAKKTAVPDDIMSQKRMAYWCDEQGLWEAAKSHWEAVLRLVPNNDEARKRLGYHFRRGQWVLDAASADEIAQKKADAYWEKELKTFLSSFSQ
jgi:hypothetical protein